jgi:predicted transcriptional regulator
MGTSTLKTKKVTISLPYETLRAADHLARKEQRTRSELMRETLRFYMKGANIPTARPTSEEVKIIESGRREFARGEVVTHKEILRDLENRVQQKSTKRSK